MTYKGKPSTVAMSAEAAFGRLSDTAAFAGMIDQMPEELRAKMGDFSVTDDAITIGTPQVGDITLKRTRLEPPRLIRYEALQSPVPLGLNILIDPAGDDAAEVRAEIDVDIPIMLRGLVGGKMQEAADKFSELLSLILSNPR